MDVPAALNAVMDAVNPTLKEFVPSALPYGNAAGVLNKEFDVLLPLHVLLIVGLAEGADPLHRALSVWPLPLLGRHLALGAYLLQVAVIYACAALP